MSLVITGSPGVGKHTVGDVLAPMLNLDVMDLNRLAADSGLVEGTSGDVDITLLQKALNPVLGPDSLVVGHLAPYVLTGRQVGTMVVLRKSPYMLGVTYEERGYTEDKARANLGAEILGVVAHDAIQAVGESKTIQIDVTDSSPKDVAARIRDSLDGGRGGDKVDWLSSVTQRGDLRRFFSYD